jgi:sirohydrochlorin cobaltochelatase
VNLTRRILLSLVVVIGLSALSWSASSDVGVLVMAHGGTPLWNKTVTEIVKRAELPYPTRIFFGMGHSREEVDKLQDQVNWLQGKGVHSIIVVPLLVSSYSEVYRQWRYLLGAAVNPGFDTNFFPVEKRVEIQFSEPLNDDPIVGLILLDRAREISQNPAQETVIIVAHGPNDESDNEKWLRSLGHLANTVKSRGHFRSVEGMTLRDDAPEEVRAQAITSIRNRVEAIEQEGGHALLIPLLIAPGGIENKVSVELKGLVYTLNAKTLLPDHRISQWIRSKAP